MSSTRMPYAIASPPICSKPAPTCAPSRCCSATATWRTPRSICISPSGISAQPPVRWTLSRFAHKENRRRSDEPASPGDGRHRSLCRDSLFSNGSQRWISWQHQKVLLAITRCRTAALGGHRDRCSGCGHTAISYNSCRNRHCPKCQGNARQHWLEARERELLPTPYVHLVFTLPREVASLALQNKRLIYNLLFHASAETLLEVARDPRHLGAEIGFFSVLHTWNQRLQHHPHIHCVLAAGGLAPDHSRWIASHPSFFLPIKVLSRVFRGKFVAGLRTAFREGRAPVPRTLIPLAQPRTFASWLRTAVPP